MAPTLLYSNYQASGATVGAGTSDTFTTASFTPANGDVIVVKAQTWDTATATGTPSGGGQTFTQRVDVAPGGFRPRTTIFTAVVSGSPGSMTVTLSAPAASSHHDMTVEVWTGAQLAATPATGSNNASSGAANGTITTTGVDSIVSWCAADAQSLSITTRAYLSSATEVGASDGSSSGNACFYSAYQSAATAGSKTYGLSAPTGMQYTIAAIEVQASAGGGSGTPTTNTTSEVDYVGTSTPTPAGTTTTASTVSITPTLPAGTASGDRVFVIQAANNTSAATPASWTAPVKDVQVGPTGTAPGAGTGRRYLSASYRDYDGAWTMPAFTLTSATQNTHAISVITLRKGATATWDTPSVSTAGNTAAAVTAYSVTTGSVATPSGMVIAATATNDNVTASAETLTATAATFANLTERSDTGSATGNDVSIKTYTADVYSGGTGTITHTATLSGASEGGTVVVSQTATDSTIILSPRHRGPLYRR